MREVLKTSVIGLGYLGATQAIVLAKLGHKVLGIDLDSKKVVSLNRGELPFFEPGLQDLLIEMLSTGRLKFVDSYTGELNDIDVHFLCVGTPRMAKSDDVDVSHVFESAKELTKYMKPDSILVGRSTAPVGTAESIKDILNSDPQSNFRVAWNPEFLSEGNALHESLRPERIVVGVEDNDSEERLRKVYQPIIDSGVPFLSMDLNTAELVKFAANSFLAMKISFINGVASVAEQKGASTRLLAEALGLDSRIGKTFLQNGLGFGGGCLPKDLAGFRQQASSVGALDFANLLRDVDLINKGRIDQVLNLSRGLLGDLTNQKISLLGASFKPNTDDIRDSQSLDLARRLLEAGANVSIHDPVVKNITDITGAVVSNDLQDTVSKTNLIILSTDWPKYSKLDPLGLGKLVASKKIIDARGVLESKKWSSAGWDIEVLGEGQ